MIPPIIIIHYHLNHGGVTRVIESQAAALISADIDYLILTGEAYSGDHTLNHTVIPELRYLPEVSNPDEMASTLYNSCRKVVQEHYGEQNVLWLIHNPTLGKNVLFPSFIAQLAHDEQKLLLLCHDFSEDGRPSNYQVVSNETHLYPVASNIHYAFINSRDYRLFLKAGLPIEQACLLPNAISPPTIFSARMSSKQKLVLYPVRGIRRKNIGEFLLWSLLAPENTLFALTLAPENKKWMPYYNIWESLVEELDLPVLLDCTNTSSTTEVIGDQYEDWLNACTHCMTTSIAEGFGMTFLEPLKLNIPLIGRDLPEITSDFKDQGVRLGNLYNKLLINSKNIDQTELYKDFINGLSISYLSYGKKIGIKEMEAAWEQYIKGAFIDFGTLPEHHQLKVLMKICDGEISNVSVQNSNGYAENAVAWLARSLNTPSTTTPQNLDYYSIEAYQERFIDQLALVWNSPTRAPSWLKPSAVLETFLSPERFHFLRSE